MPSNFKVSSDINTLLRKSTKEEAATFLGLEDTKAQWGQITGTLTNQTDLVSALALKGSASDVATNAQGISDNASDIATTSAQVDTKQDILTFGIANTNAVKIDNTSTAANSGDICKFAGSGIMPYTYADLKYDLGVDLKAPKASPVFTGTASFNNDVTIDGEFAVDSKSDFNGDVDISGSVEFQNDLTITNGGIELQDTGLEISGDGDIELTDQGKIKVGSDLEITKDTIDFDGVEVIAIEERFLSDENGDEAFTFNDRTELTFGGDGNTTTKVGIRKSTPTAALDVNGTIKANSINVNSQKFYVDPDDDYLKAGGYGTGDFTAMTGAENQPKTTPAFGSNGKVLEKTYIKTLKIQGTGFTGLGTAVQIVAAAGAGKYNVPLEMTIFNDYGTRAGEWGSNGSQASIQIGTFQNSDNTGNFAPFLTLPVTTAENTGDWLAHKTFRNIESKQFSNRDIIIKGLNYPSSEANAPDGEWYIRVEYMVLGESGGFENNVDQTIGTAF